MGGEECTVQRKMIINITSHKRFVGNSLSDTAEDMFDDSWLHYITTGNVRIARQISVHI